MNYQASPLLCSIIIGFHKLDIYGLNCLYTATTKLSCVRMSKGVCLRQHCRFPIHEYGDGDAIYLSSLFAPKCGIA